MVKRTLVVIAVLFVLVSALGANAITVKHVPVIKKFYKYGMLITGKQSLPIPATGGVFADVEFTTLEGLIYKFRAEGFPDHVNIVSPDGSHRLHFREGKSPDDRNIPLNDYAVLTASVHGLPHYTHIVKYIGHDTAAHTLKFADPATGGREVTYDPATNKAELVAGGVTYAITVDPATGSLTIDQNADGKLDGAWAAIVDIKEKKISEFAFIQMVGTQPSCTDSDNGKNYFVKGAASGDLTPFGYPNVVGPASDFCVQLKDGKYPWVYDPSWQGQVFNNPVIASCVKDCAVYEMYCSAQGQLLGEAPPCPNGCANGACLAAPTCTDSDGGSNYAVPGSVSYTNNPYGVGQEFDICDGNVLAERVCKSQTEYTQNFEHYTCPNGCKDGACLLGPCSDTDNSPDYIKNPIVFPLTQVKYPDFFIKGTGKGDYGGQGVYVIYGTEPNPMFPKSTTDPYSTFVDHCVGENQLNEAYCMSDGRLGAHGINCPNGCANGACLAAPAPTPTCTDSDGGQKYAVKGSVSYTNNPYGVGQEFDICDVGNVLVERICNSPTEYTTNFERYTCPNGCANGACIAAPQPISQCSDTDGGNFPFVAGQSAAPAYIVKPGGGADPTENAATETNIFWGENTNRCGSRRDLSLNGERFNDCCQYAGVSNVLYEAYCVKDFIMSEPFTCPNGCSNGACVAAPTPAPTPAPVPAPVPQPISPCTDSDGGINYLVAGTAGDDRQTYGQPYRVTDVCSRFTNGLLREYYCANGRVTSTDYSCPGPGTCVDGACTSPPQTIQSIPVPAPAPTPPAPAPVSVVSEIVTCIFTNSQVKTQTCTFDGGTCSGTKGCRIKLIGPQGKRINWASTCRGTATTTLDGKNEVARFDCSLLK